MLLWTGPAVLLAFSIYLVACFTIIAADGASFGRIDAIPSALQANFLISPWLLVPALLVIVLAVKRMPPIPSLFAGVLAGGAAAMIAQGSGLHDIFTYANSGYAIETGISEIDKIGRAHV